MLLPSLIPRPYCIGKGLGARLALTLCCWIDLVALNLCLVPWTLDLRLSLHRSYIGAETRDDGQHRQCRLGPARDTHARA